MDRVFPTGDEFLDHQFWSPPPLPQQLSPKADNPQMNGSASEWDLGRIFQEFAAASSKSDEILSSSSSVLRCYGSEIEDHHQNIQSAGLNQISSHTSKPDIGNQQSVAVAPAAINKPAGSLSLPVGSEEFMMFLKNQLSMACAAASTKPPLPQQLSSKADSPQTDRSASEWAFERFFQGFAAASSKPDETLSSSTSVVRGDVSEIEDHHQKNHRNIQSAGLNQISSHTSKPDLGNKQSVAAAPAAIDKTAGSSGLPIEKYMMFLKNQLSMACAAVASTKGSSGVGPSSSGLAESADSHSGSRVLVQGSKEEDTGGSVAIPALPAREKSVAQTKITTSGSEQSDDYELDGENEMTQVMDPTTAKRVKRMLSNRESARRGRMRKQAHLTELETEVSAVRAENSFLLKSLTDMTAKYSDAAVHNRVLKADVEILGAKLKMAAETIKRYNEMNPVVQVLSEICSTMPPNSWNPDTGRRTDAAE